ncbi:hypothetical protein [Chelativorans salis]|uniref:Uncharacterized protein n=1 Tax=Chelativorans salis TaxID=2978478 RepID=A0ABT2LLF1_9HYPH|nr:hypothetical protein [Chelativorans sp. EGI FJ00035]MCT7374488.1 hypothetical protein [Chelativorans sp. EGI FJ00035]
MFIETPASPRLIGSPHVEHDIAGISVGRRALVAMAGSPESIPSVGTQYVCEAQHDGVPMPEHSPIVVNKQLIFITELPIVRRGLNVV